MLFDITKPWFTAEHICNALHGFLLTNHSIETISIFDLDTFYDDLIFIFDQKDRIVKASKNRFEIIETDIIANKSLITETKQFLKNQLVKLILPKYYKHGDFSSFMDRYQTQESYSPKTLKLFDEIAEDLYNSESIIPDFSTDSLINVFSKAIKQNRYPWLRLISDLINEELFAGDDAARYFENEDDTFDPFEIIESSLGVPPLIRLENGSLQVCNGCFEDNLSIIPYLIPLMRFGYAPSTTINTIFYSYLQKSRQL